MFAPYLHVSRRVDGVSRRPWLGIDFLDLLARLCANDRAVRTTKGDSIDAIQLVECIRLQYRNQFFESELAFADYNNVGAGCEVLRNVSARLRTANQCSPARLFSHAENFDNVGTGHQVRIDSENGWGPF